MKTESIFSWAHFLTKLANMSRTQYMLRLNMVFQPLTSFMCIWTFKAHEFSGLTSNHL